MSHTKFRVEEIHYWLIRESKFHLRVNRPKIVCKKKVSNSFSTREKTAIKFDKIGNCQQKCKTFSEYNKILRLLTDFFPYNEPCQPKQTFKKIFCLQMEWFKHTNSKMFEVMLGAEAYNTPGTLLIGNPNSILMIIFKEEHARVNFKEPQLHIYFITLHIYVMNYITIVSKITEEFIKNDSTSIVMSCKIIM